MKKITLFTMISFMILGLASFAMAADVSSGVVNGTNVIDLDGAGVGMDGVAISAKGQALYTSDAGAGGLGTVDQEQYAIVTGSTAGTTGIHLDFMMRGSQSVPDNNVYQLLTGTLGISTATSVNPTTATGWRIRGGS